MIMHQGNKIIEFTIDGYQFPAEKTCNEGFDYDANWLMCEVKYSDAEVNETYMDPCLLTDEMAYFVEELSKILEGAEEGFISDFMEPYLKIAATRIDENIVIIFQFVYDTTDGIWKKRKITAVLSQEETAEMVQDLKDLVNKYPKR